MRGLLPIAVLLLSAATCDLPFGASVGTNDVSARLDADYVHVTNRSSAMIHYMIIGEESILDWVPCMRDDCPHLESRESARQPFSEIPGGQSDNIDVYWWVRTSGEVADWEDVRRIRLRR